MGPVRNQSHRFRQTAWDFEPGPEGDDSAYELDGDEDLCSEEEEDSDEDAAPDPFDLLDEEE